MRCYRALLTLSDGGWQYFVFVLAPTIDDALAQVKKKGAQFTKDRGVSGGEFIINIIKDVGFGL